jgi:polyphosphate kinase
MRHHLDDDGNPRTDLQADLIEMHARRRRKARRR